MPQLSNIMKQTKRFGPQAAKMAKKIGPKASKSAFSKATKATKDAASKASHYASDYSQKAAKTAKKALPDKNRHMHKPSPATKPKKSGPMLGVSLTKAFLMIAGSAVAALLFAPKPGKELREDLKHRASDMKEKGMNEAKGMMHDARDTYTEVKHKRQAQSHSENTQDSSMSGGMDGPNGVSAASNDSIPAEAAPLTTDEYASQSAYDDTADVSVPLDTDLTASSLTPEEDRPTPL